MADECPTCFGEGYYPDHHPECWGKCGKFGCPVPVQCERCQGTGEV